MPRKELVALIEAADENPEEKVLRAPAVGRFRSDLPERTGVVPGLKLGTMSILAHVYPVTAPQNAYGVITKVLAEPGTNPVDYGRPLFQLGSGAGLEAGSAAGDATGVGGGVGGAGNIAIEAPTDGVFYRRPDPQAPAYAEVGDVVELGRPLGLVEVMKCFNQIRYEGAGLPARAKVVAVHAEDSAEIEQGQTLFELVGED